MRTAVVEIESGRVVNVIERGVQPPNPRIVEATEPPEGFLWVEHDTAGPGWRLVDGSLQAPVVVVPEPTPLQMIVALEAQQTPRLIREAALGGEYAKNRLKEIDDQIKVIRAGL